MGANAGLREKGLRDCQVTKGRAEETVGPTRNDLLYLVVMYTQQANESMDTSAALVGMYIPYGVIVCTSCLPCPSSLKMSAGTSLP